MAKPIKRYLKAHFPGLFRIGWPQPTSGENSVEATFTKKFHRHQARNMDSLSGPGSVLAQTASVRRRLPGLLRELNCSSLLDLPCGDSIDQYARPGHDYVGGTSSRSWSSATNGSFKAHVAGFCGWTCSGTNCGSGSGSVPRLPGACFESRHRASLETSLDRAAAIC